MISSTTIKMAEQKPGQVWCEPGKHFVHEDDYDREYDCCIWCLEIRTKEGE